MADVRSIDIFIRAHDEASKVFAKLAAETKALQASVTGQVKVAETAARDSARIQEATDKARSVTRAREEEKLQAALKKMQADTAEFTKRLQAQVQSTVEKSLVQIQLLHAKSATTIQETEAKSAARQRELKINAAEYEKRHLAEIERLALKHANAIDEIEAKAAAKKADRVDAFAAKEAFLATQEARRKAIEIARQAADEQRLARVRQQLANARQVAESRGANAAGAGGLIADARARVFPDAAAAVATIDRLNDRITTLHAKLAVTGKISAVELGVLAESANLAERAVNDLASKGGQAAASMGGFKGVIDDIRGAALGADGPLHSIFGMLSLAITLLAPLAGGLAQIAGALYAVGAAAGFAAAALGGALVSALAQLVPLVGLAVVAFVGIAKVLQISSQQQKNSIADAGRLGTANKNLANTADQLRNAQEGVVSAQKALTKARHDAIRQLHDLADAEREAQLAARSANLSVVEAQLALQSAIAGGDALATRRAQLDLEGAQINASQAGRAASRSTADAATTRGKGVEGSDQVVAAKKSLEQAERSLAAAQRSGAAATNQASAANSRLNEEIKRLTPEQKRLLKAVNDFREVLRGPEFSKITDIVIEPFTRAVKELTKLLKDPVILNAITGLATAWAKIADGLIKKLDTPVVRDFFVKMMKEGAKNAPIVGQILDHLGSLFGKVAEEAAPLVTWILQGIADLLGDIDKKASHNALKDFFDSAMADEGPLHAIWDLLSELFNLLVNLGAEGGAADAGVDLIERLASAIKDVNDRFNSDDPKDKAWVKSVQQFFKDSAKGFGDFAAALGDLLAVFITADPKALQKWSNFITIVVKPVLEDLIVLSDKLSTGIDKLFTSPLGPILAWLVTVLLITKAFGVMALIVPILEGALYALALAVGAVMGAFGLALLPAILIVAAIVAVVAIIVILGIKFGIFRKIWEAAWPVIKAVFRAAKDYVLDNIAVMVAGFDTIVAGVKKVIKLVKALVNTDWKAVWRDFKHIVSDVGGTLGNTFVTLVNIVIGGLNKIIEGLNWFLRLVRKIGIHFPEIPPIPYQGKPSTNSDNAAVSSQKRAIGGWVRARPGGQLNTLGEAGYDELVLSTDPKMAPRNRMLIREFNAKANETDKNSLQGKSEGDPGAKTPRASGGGGHSRPSIGGRGGGTAGAIMHLVEMIAEAEKLDSQNWPYSWGGGHVNPARPTGGIGGSPSGNSGVGIIGYDCSSSVSRVLQQAYPSMPTMTSGMFPGYSSLFARGQGKTTVWSSPGHVFMDLAGRRWGTGANSRGGPGWHGHGTGGFTPVHPKDLPSNLGGGGFLGQALRRAERLGGKALSELADGIRKMASFATNFGGRFVSAFGGRPDNPLTAMIYDFVKSNVAKSVEKVVGFNIPGFKYGGVVPGSGAVPAIVHGGERILTPSNVTSLVTAGQKVVNDLLTGIFGKTGLQGARYIGTGKQIDEVTNKIVTFFARLTSAIDAVTKTIGRMTADFAHKISSQRFGVRRDGSVVENTSESFDISVTEQTQTELINERKQIQKQQQENNAGLSAATARKAGIDARVKSTNARANLDRYTKLLRAELKKRKPNAAKVKRYRAKIAQYTALLGQQQAVNAGIIGIQDQGVQLQADLDANIANTDAAQDAELEARLNVGADEDVRIGSSQLRQQLAAGRNDVAGQKKELGIQGGLIAQKIKELTAQQKLYAPGSPEWQKFQDALVQNQIALEENTKAIEELTGGELQDFSSSSWTMFRAAVFNGLGGLMPQFQIPSAAVGANVLTSGLLQVHSGERVTPAQVARSNNWANGDTNIEINIDQAGQDLDVEYLARRMAFEARGM